MPPRDTERTSVYRAEDLYARMCERAHPPMGPPVLTDLAGSQVLLPAERRFGDLDSVQRFVDVVLPAACELWQVHLPPVQVRRRKGNGQGALGAPSTIALAEDQAWLREFIVLHELAHHIDHHTRGKQPAPAHGTSFRTALCRLHTLATGPVGAGPWASSSTWSSAATWPPNDPERNRVPTIDTVAALLAKAERTDNPDEADAYLSKAQQLATLYAIDLAAAAAANGGRSRSTRPVQRTIVMGQPRKHVLPHLVGLFLAIARPNDVKADIAHNSTYVIAYGLPDDIDTVESIWLACAPRMVHEVRSGSPATPGAATWSRGGRAMGWRRCR